MIQGRNVQSLKNNQQLNQQTKVKTSNKPQKLINYTELRTLKNNKPHKLLAGLQNKSKSFINKRSNKSEVTCQYENQEPKLLTTAVSLLKKQYDQNQNLQIQNHSNRLSYYFNSRDITPINPSLGASLHNNSSVSKKRIKTHLSNKSRLQSITSDLHQMESQEQSHGNILPVYKQKSFKLYDHVLGQSEAVYHYAFGKQRKIPAKLIYLWKQCLFHQDKTEVYVPVNPQESSNIPYTHPRIFPINELEKGFQEVYGSGKHRCLKVGEQALIIEGIRKYLLKCETEPMKISRKDYDIIADVLVQTKLTDIQNYPMCYKQIQGHFKVMATRWRYQNLENKTNRMFQPAIINGKNNFIDLGKPGILSDYLLAHSNKKEFL